jgi:uncharacterized protein YceK
MHHVLLAMLLSLLAGCASTRARTYQPPTAPVSMNPAAVTRSAVRHAQGQGWTVTRVDREVGLVEAVTTEEDLEGIRVREWWTFRVEQDRVQARLRTEFVLHDGGDWESSPLVCAGYSYLREASHLEAVLALAAADPGVAMETSRRLGSGRPPRSAP